MPRTRKTAQEKCSFRLSSSETKLAKQAYERLVDSVEIREDGTVSIKDLRISLRTYKRILKALSCHAKGHDVMVRKRDLSLTPQEAASILSVSRPHVVSMLEEGQMPYYRVGTHRRIWYRDVVTHLRTSKHDPEDDLL